MSNSMIFVPVQSENIQSEMLVVSSFNKSKVPADYVSLEGKVFKIDFSENLNPQEILLSNFTKMLIYQMDDLPQICQVTPFEPKKQHELHEVQISLFYDSKPKEARKELSRGWLAQQFKKTFIGKYLNNLQNVPFQLNNFRFQGMINIMDPSIQFGYITNKTNLQFVPLPYQNFTLVEFVEEQDIQDLKINEKVLEEEDQIDLKSKILATKAGGLGPQIKEIQRRIFTSRKFSGLQFQRLGMKHAKGMILYGPPGTGKTLLAKELANVLDVKPTIVNGPEIMDKYVGEGQRKLRQIFQPAIDQYQKKGNQSSLYVIIFDEIDSITKRRGSSDSSIGDTLVNQLLTLIDGVQSPNNILVIGMTNRLDLIDEALLRPGRLEVHVEVFLPSEEGRKQIFDIHLKDFKREGILEDNVNIAELAKRAKNFTGAEIAAIVRSSFTFAVNDYASRGNKVKSIKDIKIAQKHFELAKTDITPQFGQDQKQINNLIPKSEINLNEIMPSVFKSAQIWMEKCHKIEEGRMALLIKGIPRSGKTVLASKCCKMIDLSFTKWVSCDKIYSLTQKQRVQYLIKVLEDSKKCTESCIVLDGLLRLIQYVPLGHKYNNTLLQLVKNIIQSSNEKGKKKVVIVTCDSVNVLDDLGISKVFNHIIQMGTFSRQKALDLIERNHTNIMDLMLDQSQSQFTIGQIAEITQQQKA